MDSRITLYAVALSVAAQPALSTAWRMLHENGPEEIYEYLAACGELKTQAHLSGKYSNSPVETAHWILDRIRKLQVQPIHFWDRRYPPLLRQIAAPPVVLYARGELAQEKAVAIVGTRKARAEGREIARRLSRECAASGLAIISGMAVGIDRESHLGALDIDKPTVGVLASGIDTAYPRRNRDLFTLIGKSESSSLVSEYPPGFHPEKWTFVRRNRIISGMAAGCVVVQAPERSGALITARHALEQNREVFACTGYTFDPGFRGCRNLIHEGAIPVSDSKDVVNVLFPGQVSLRAGDGPDRQRIRDAVDDLLPEGLVERRVMHLLRDTVLDIDSIIRETGEDAGTINRIVAELEINGSVSRNGNRVRRIA